MISPFHRAVRRRRRALRAAVQERIGSALRSSWHEVECAFVLSTGRTGTATLTELFDHVPNATASHEPRPQLLKERTEARYEIAGAPKRYWEIFVRARGYRLLQAHRAGEQYVETSSRLTFFAPVLHAHLPNARFLYVHREPWDVVRSGMRRGWYIDHPNDPVRLRPGPDEPLAATWDQLSPFEKNCWYWAACNRFALDFCDRVGWERVLEVQANDLFSGAALDEIFDFLHLERPPQQALKQELNARHNAQQAAHFPKVDAWSDEQRATLLAYAGPEMERLGYSLPA